MEPVSLVFTALELLGTVAFAISGAMVAIQKRADIFGVLVLGVTTATGGGLMRDVLLGHLPPRLFENRLYLFVAAGAALAIFLVARVFQEKFLRRAALVDQVNNLFDAVGLGAFTVTGIQTGIAAGYVGNRFLLVFLGVLTGVGGGLIRDLMVMEIPFVLRKRVYALAAIAGGLAYVFSQPLCRSHAVPVTLTLAVVVGLRLLATVFRWDLPKAIP